MQQFYRFVFSSLCKPPHPDGLPACYSVLVRHGISRLGYCDEDSPTCHPLSLLSPGVARKRCAACMRASSCNRTLFLRSCSCSDTFLLCFRHHPAMAAASTLTESRDRPKKSHHKRSHQATWSATAMHALFLSALQASAQRTLCCWYRQHSLVTSQCSVALRRRHLHLQGLELVVRL